MTCHDSPIARLQTFILESIPLTRSIGLTVEAWDGDSLTMTAPLAPNVNDKGCAFGGSLASVMTLAGWGLVALQLETHGLSCDVFVGRSEVVYSAPVWKDFRVSATLAEGMSWETFLATLQTRSKARVGIFSQAREHDGTLVCASLNAQFVAKRRQESGHDSAPADAAQ